MIMAAAMGADEFGFGSLAMIATGCIMARICHTNNCPVGVASQVSCNSFLVLKGKKKFVLACEGFVRVFQTDDDY